MFDMIDVTGTMTLGGVLDLSVLGGAAPVPGVTLPNAHGRRHPGRI